MDSGDASVKLALKETDIREIEEYFTALEQNLDHQQQLLKEQQEQHHLELTAVERLRVQERMEWEREWREREEALLSTLKAMLVSRERLMGDIRSCSVPLVSIKHLAVANEEEKPRKWRLHKKPQATSDAAPQDAHSHSSSSSRSKASKEAEEEEFSMQELLKLEERVRKAEAQRLLKGQRKAEQKAKKAERRRAKEEKQMEKRSGGAKEAQPKRFWNILTMGCASSASHD